MTKVKLTFPIIPRTKQAVRFGRKGAYQPKSVTDFEAAVKERCRQYMEDTGIPQITHPVRVHVRLRKDQFVVQITPMDTELRTTVKGDVDNYAKAILDGMQGEGGLIANDRQVYELTILKHVRPLSQTKKRKKGKK